MIQASARSVRDAPAAGNEIEAVFKNFQQLFEDGKKNVFDFMGVKNDEEATALVKTEAQTFFDKLATIGKDLKKTSEDAAAKIENDETVKSFRAKVTQAIEDFKKANPEVAEGAKNLNEKLQGTLETIAAEAKKLGESAQNPELQQQFKDIAKKVLDTTSETVKDLNTKLSTVGKQ